MKLCKDCIFWDNSENRNSSDHIWYDFKCSNKMFVEIEFEYVFGSKREIKPYCKDVNKNGQCSKFKKNNH